MVSSKAKSRKGTKGNHKKTAAVKGKTSALLSRPASEPAAVPPQRYTFRQKATVLPVNRLGVPTYDEEVLVATAESAKSRADDIRAFVGALWHQAHGAAPGAVWQTPG